MAVESGKSVSTIEIERDSVPTDLISVLWAIGPRWKWLVVVPVVVGAAAFGLAQLKADEYVAATALIVGADGPQGDKGKLSVQAVALLTPEDLAALDPMPVASPGMCRLLAELPSTLVLVQRQVWPDGKGAWSVAKLESRLTARGSPGGVKLMAQANRAELAVRLAEAWAEASAGEVHRLQAEALRSIISSLERHIAQLADELAAAGSTPAAGSGHGTESPSVVGPANVNQHTDGESARVPQSPGPTTGQSSLAHRALAAQAGNVVRAAQELIYIALSTRLSLARLRLASLDTSVQAAGDVAEPASAVGPDRRFFGVVAGACALFGTLAVLMLQASVRLSRPRTRLTGAPAPSSKQE